MSEEKNYITTCGVCKKELVTHEHPDRAYISVYATVTTYRGSKMKEIKVMKDYCSDCWSNRGTEFMNFIDRE